MRPTCRFHLKNLGPGLDFILDPRDCPTAIPPAITISFSAEVRPRPVKRPLYIDDAFCSFQGNVELQEDLDLFRYLQVCDFVKLSSGNRFNIGQSYKSERPHLKTLRLNLPSLPRPSDKDWDSALIRVNNSTRCSRPKLGTI